MFFPAAHLPDGFLTGEVCFAEFVLDHGPAEGSRPPPLSGRLPDGLDEPYGGEDDVKDEGDEQEADEPRDEEHIGIFSEIRTVCQIGS